MSYRNKVYKISNLIYKPEFNASEYAHELQHARKEKIGLYQGSYIHLSERFTCTPYPS